MNQDIWMTNIHLLGGEEMIQAAKKEAKEHSESGFFNWSDSSHKP